MHLDIFEAAVCLCKLESVARVGVHVSVRQRCASITEELHHLMDGLLMAGEEVPEDCRILCIRLRVPLLCMDDFKGNMDQLVFR